MQASVDKKAGKFAWSSHPRTGEGGPTEMNHKQKLLASACEIYGSDHCQQPRSAVIAVLGPAGDSAGSSAAVTSPMMGPVSEAYSSLFLFLLSATVRVRILCNVGWMNVLGGGGRGRVSA